MLRGARKGDRRTRTTIVPTRRPSGRSPLPSLFTLFPGLIIGSARRRLLSSPTKPAGEESMWDSKSEGERRQAQDPSRLVNRRGSVNTGRQAGNVATVATVALDDTLVGW